MHVLRNMVKAVRSSRTVLDLQVIRPNPRVEIGDELFCEVDGEPLFRRADAAVGAIDALIRQGQLSEQASTITTCANTTQTGPTSSTTSATRSGGYPKWLYPNC